MFRRIQMEIIVALVFLGGALWWFFIRDEKKPEVSAPYKVETPAPAVVGKPADEIVETTAPAAEPAKATKPKTAARTAKPKVPAKAKAPAKAPAKPRATKAKPQA